MQEADIAALKEQVFGSNGQSNNPSSQPQQPNNETPSVPKEEIDAAPKAVVYEDGKSLKVESTSPSSNDDEEEEIISPQDWLKRELNVDDIEVLKSERDELKKYKENPPEYKFADENSKKMAEAISKGDRKTILKMLQTEEKIESLLTKEVNDDTAEEILKAFIELKHDDLTPKEIEHKFNKEFGLPKQPVQKVSETDGEFEERMSEWKEKVDEIKINRRVEAKIRKPELDQFKSKIVLPEIKSSQPNEAFEKYQQEEKAIAQMREFEKKEFSKLTSKDVKMLFKFNDEASKLAFDIEYEPEKEGFDKAILDASDPTLFFEQFYDKDGNPNRKEMAKAMYVVRNINKIVSEAIVQSNNQTKLWFLKNQKNVSDGVQRNYVVPPTTDIQRLKEQVFS